MTIKKKAKNGGSSDVVVQSPKESHESDDDNRSSNNATAEKLNKISYPEITIIYEDERLEINLNAKGFSFQAVDAWIRSRFGIQPTDPLRYMNKLGAEHIPSSEDIAEGNPIYVKRIQKKVESNSSNGNQWFSHTFFIITTFSFFLALYSKVLFSQYFSIRELCDNIDLVMMGLGVFPKKGIAMEAFMAFVCWSSTYLFIRRLWNPETMKTTVEKYSADSFFGGLAAAGSIILKNILTAALTEK